MADNQIEIDVVLNSEDAVEGFETLGETSSAIAERFSKDNSKLGEGLGQLTGNVTAVVGSVKGLGAVFATTGAAGKTAWISMLGPIAAVVAAEAVLHLKLQKKVLLQNSLNLKLKRKKQNQPLL